MELNLLHELPDWNKDFSAQDEIAKNLESALGIFWEIMAQWKK